MSTVADGSAGILARLSVALAEGDAALVDDADLLDPEFAELLTRAAATTVDPADALAFGADLLDRACIRTGSVGEGAGAVSVRTDLFVVPIVGLDCAVASVLASDDDFAFLARSFREHGLLAERSAVVLPRGVFGPEAVLGATPGSIAAAAAAAEEAVVSGIEGLDADMAEAGIVEMLAGTPAHRLPDADPAQASALVLRCLVGARVAAWTDGDPFDGDAASGVDDPEAAAAWWEATAGRFAARGVEVGLPSDWNTGAASAAFMYARAAIERAQAAAGVPDGTPADDQHRFYDAREGTLALSMRYGTTMVGPVVVPVAVAGRTPRIFMDALSSLAERIVVHGTMESLATCRVRGEDA